MSALFISSRWSLLFAFSCAAVSGLSGCDGEVTTGAGGNGGSGGSGGSGGANACEAFVTSPPQTDVTVRITNNSDADIFIGPETTGGCGQVDPFSLADADGNDVAWRLKACSFTCEELQSGACGCAADCALPVVWRLAPGGVLEVPWQGTTYSIETMPDACYGGGCETQSCFVERPAPGASTFSASAWTQVTGSCGGPCTCTPDANGLCTIGTGEAAVTGVKLTTFTMVGALGATVDLSFD